MTYFKPSKIFNTWHDFQEYFDGGVLTSSSECGLEEDKHIYTKYPPLIWTNIKDKNTLVDPTDENVLVIVKNKILKWDFDMKYNIDGMKYDKKYKETKINNKNPICDLNKLIKFVLNSPVEKYYLIVSGLLALNKFCLYYTTNETAYTLIQINGSLGNSRKSWYYNTDHNVHSAENKIKELYLSDKQQNGGHNINTLIGAHIDSEFDNLISEAERVHNLDGTIIQLFVSTAHKKDKNYNNFIKFLKNTNMKCVVHASYTINCAQKWDYHSWWIKQFIVEIEIADTINAIGIVIHLGKQLDLSIEESLNNMYMSLLYVHAQTKQHKNVKIFIETSTGQGSEICFEMENLAHFFKKFSKHKNSEINERFGICLDTCHVFSAGYDLTNKNAIKTFLNTFDKLIGLEQIKLVHLNDSKREIGSKVDRHANIGNGYIGKDGIIFIIKMFKRLGIPIILETPNEKQNDDLELLVNLN